MDNDSLLTRVRSKVEKGACLLDEKRPGWFRFDFDWYSFDIDSAGKCILGQRFAEETAAAGKTNPYTYGLAELDAPFPSEHGFVSTSFSRYVYPEVIAAYKSAWKAAVDARLAGSVQDTPAESGFTVTLNDTERQLLIDLLEVREDELNEEKSKLKPQYREFIDVPLMTNHALLVALRG